MTLEHVAAQKSNQRTKSRQHKQLILLTYKYHKTKKFIWKNVLGKIYFRSKNWKILGLEGQIRVPTYCYEKVYDIYYI